MKYKMAKRREKDPNKMITTLRYRIKDSSELNRLELMSRSVNFVWNYCNETSYNAIRNNGKFLSGFDLNNLTSGSSKELGLRSSNYVPRQRCVHLLCHFGFALIWGIPQTLL